MSKIAINEIFSSIQGEGVFVGSPATFIRLQGCSVGCFFCDTKNSWSKKFGIEFSIEDIISKIDTAHVVITGGEPFEQDISQLIGAIYDAFPEITIQIEASGTGFYKIDDKVFLTISPKFLSKMPVLEESLLRANEIKLVITAEKDLLFLERLPKSGAVVSLQPEGNREELIKLCYEYCLKNGLRLSVQMHKFLNIR